jgi:small subunit ribosomal protein S1
MSDNDFAKLFEEASQSDLQNGQIAKGLIHAISSDSAFIDLGYKSEGIVSLSEFKEKPNVGDEVFVYIESLEDYNGNIRVSKEKADNVLNKEKLFEAHKSNLPIKGKVISLTENRSSEKRGGFIIDIGIGKDAFCPYSQIDDVRINDDTEKNYIGKTFEFAINSIDTKNNKIVLSRRELIYKKKQDAETNFFEEVKTGDIYTGIIKNFNKNGIFILINEHITGFCHISEVSYQRIRKPEDILEIDQEVKVKIIDINKTAKKIGLSIKATEEDPWNNFTKNHFVGDTLDGRVSDFVKDGVLINVADGIDGFVPISELSWVKKVRSAKDVLSYNQNVKVQILNIKTDERRLVLGVRQLMDNPWEEIENKYPVGEKVAGKITKVVDFGIFVQLDNGIEGLLHKNDISWIPEKCDLSQFKKKDEITVMVISINKKDQTISLGLKQLENNPWKDYINKNGKNSIVNGVVKEITKSGVVVTLADEIEGYLHVSEISNKHIEDPNEIYKIGDAIEAIITETNLKKNKISLSVKSLQKKLERDEIKKYTKPEDEGKTTLGDFFDFSKINLKNKK